MLNKKLRPFVVGATLLVSFYDYSEGDIKTAIVGSLIALGLLVVYAMEPKD